MSSTGAGEKNLGEREVARATSSGPAPRTCSRAHKERSEPSPTGLALSVLGENVTLTILQRQYWRIGMMDSVKW